MNSSQIALIAERMGWVKLQSDGDEPSVYYPGNWDEYETAVAKYKPKGGGWQWHLTSAGAFEVLVEMKLCVEWAIDGLDVRVMGVLSNELSREESPHTAIALAALAMIEEGE